MKTQKILILKLGAIGDLVMLTPALRSLRCAYPDAVISFLIGEEYKDVISGNTNINELIIARDFKRKKRSYVNIIKLLSKIKEKHFDTVINCHTSWLMNLFSFLTGAKMRIGFDINGGFLNTTTTNYDNLKDKHDAKKYLELVKHVGGKPTTMKYDLYFSKKDDESVAKRLNTLDLGGKKLIGFVVGGGGDSPFHLNRRWPIENWIELAKYISKRYPKLKILLIGDKDDYTISEEVKNKTNNTINGCGLFSIKETMALMKRLKLLITTDTGPMHLAAPFTKVIALFGPTSPEQFTPSPKEKHTVIQKDILCGPCYKNEKYKICYNNKCMKTISPEEVFNKISLKIIYNN